MRRGGAGVLILRVPLSAQLKLFTADSKQHKNLFRLSGDKAKCDRCVSLFSNLGVFRKEPAVTLQAATNMERMQVGNIAGSTKATVP